MALIHCAECNKEISSLAVTCPNCGAPPIVQIEPTEPPSGKTKKVLHGALLVIGGTVITVYVALLFPAAPAPAPKVVPSVTVQQVIAPPPPTVEELAAKAQEDKRDQNVLIVVNHIRKLARNPDSLKWIVIKADDEGDLVCLSYRAQNGFGGMNIESAVVVGSKISHSAENVKKYCSKRPLHDMTWLAESGL